jgi:hypothetical protein
MPWVKENYDRFLLALTAFVLAASAGLLFIKARGFGEVFRSLGDQVQHSTAIPAVDLDSISKQTAQITKPDTWKDRKVGERSLPLLVSVPIIEKTELDPATGAMVVKAVDPLAGGDSNLDLHPPVPNRWLLDNKQDLLAQNVLTQDSDGDGFTTLDEYLGKTDPQNKESHPGYLTKLFMQQFVRVPFRLLFAARNGNTVLLNTLDDPDAPTQFLQVGKDVAGTKFKVTDLKIKEAKVNGMTKDVSEVTLTHKDTGEKIVLVKEQVVDSPTTYAKMTYLWAGQVFDLKKGQEFTLKPEDKVKYRAIALDDNGVTLLKVDDNKEIKIGKLPPQAK